MDQASYRNRPVGSVKALAHALSASESILQRLADNAEQYYCVARAIQKVDGSVRTVYCVQNPLKTIQQRIKRRFLDNVHYPVYLQGGIRDRENPRDYAKNAGTHVGCKTLISEDISNFFPSVSSEVVLDIWTHFFKFPYSVAAILTKLTVKDDGLPQGASTSSHLANLVFSKTEPRLVVQLHSEHFNYTRYVDDISVSSSSHIKDESKGKVISLIRGMVAQRDLHLNARKHTIYSSGKRMLVNNLVVNNKTSVRPEERARIRAAVHQCELTSVTDHESKEFRALLQSTKGRVRHLARFHKSEAATLMNRLVLLPTPTSLK